MCSSTSWKPSARSQARVLSSTTGRLGQNDAVWNTCREKTQTATARLTGTSFARLGEFAQCTVTWRRTYRAPHRTSAYLALLADLLGKDRPQLFHAWLEHLLPRCLEVPLQVYDRLLLRHECLLSTLLRHRVSPEGRRRHLWSFSGLGTSSPLPR